MPLKFGDLDAKSAAIQSAIAGESWPMNPNHPPSLREIVAASGLQATRTYHKARNLTTLPVAIKI